MSSSDLRVLFFTDISQFWANEREQKFAQINFLSKIFFLRFELLKNIMTIIGEKKRWK